MRFLKLAYLSKVDNIGGLVPKDDFMEIFQKVDLVDDDFHKDNFEPGTGGESRLFKQLKADTEIE